uniref:PH-like domain-containing protein n=1 Tax=Trypanosoma vivax (strain Y486) TaxID=1055687 RepID=G0TYW1_TRYVY|nr:conserved hypothetical protein [Trypanosoma vivax Y486]
MVPRCRESVLRARRSICAAVKSSVLPSKASSMSSLIVSRDSDLFVSKSFNADASSVSRLVDENYLDPPDSIFFPSLSVFTGLGAVKLDSDIFECCDDVSRVLRFRPLWSLVGSFRCVLQSLVCVEYSSGLLKWLQLSPSGGVHAMRLSLSSIVDAQLVRPSSHSVNTDHATQWVIISSSSNPSRVVFCFAEPSFAKRMVLALRSSHVP